MKSNLKFDEALSDGELLYYCVRTSKGTSIASVHQNECPFEGDEVITLEDAKKYAELFASAPALLEENERLKNEVAILEVYKKVVHSNRVWDEVRQFVLDFLPYTPEHIPTATINTLKELRAEVGRLTKEEKLLIKTLREEFLVNTENYPREYHALFSEKFNRAIETFQSTRIK